MRSSPSPVTSSTTKRERDQRAPVEHEQVAGRVGHDRRRPSRAGRPSVVTTPAPDELVHPQDVGVVERRGPQHPGRAGTRRSSSESTPVEARPGIGPGGDATSAMHELGGRRRTRAPSPQPRARSGWSTARRRPRRAGRGACTIRPTSSRVLGWPASATSGSGRPGTPGAWGPLGPWAPPGPGDATNSLVVDDVDRGVHPVAGPAAPTTVRMAWATRPRRPITRPMSSGATWMRKRASAADSSVSTTTASGSLARTAGDVVEHGHRRPAVDPVARHVVDPSPALGQSTSLTSSRT